MIATRSKIRHGLVYSDVRPRDRQNFSSCQKVCQETVFGMLKTMEDSIPNTKGIYVYLKLIECVILAYCENGLSLMERLHYAWMAVFICRFWRVWLHTQPRKTIEKTFSTKFDTLVASLSSQSTIKIKTPRPSAKRTKRLFTITDPALFSIEINAHSLTYLVLLAIDGQLPFDALSIQRLNSQSCESVFRSARAMSGVSSNMVNFTVLDFLRRADKISALQSIKTEEENSSDLRFPKHHKHGKFARDSSSSSTITYSSIRLIDIEKIVEGAFGIAYELIEPLIGKDTLKTSIYKTTTSLSKLIVKLYEISKVKSRSTQPQQVFNDPSEEINNEDEDEDEDDEDEDEDDEDEDDEDEEDTEDDTEDEHSEDEEQDLSHVLLDSSNASFRGMRVKESIDQSQSDSFFKVRRENDTTDVYIHKQTACWVLTNEKLSLSSDRLTRVTQSK